ncbi:MAG: hypothetical protein LAP13_03110 [Acidobacteriia bacterium]|nr:hypothetical protein [Terriglobia bacterium]
MNHLEGMKRDLLAAVVLGLVVSSSLVAGDGVAPISYDLRVHINPDSGSIAVEGSAKVPLENPHARNFRFNLHDTFTIKKLWINGKEASFSFADAEPLPLTPAARTVVVSLPLDIAQGQVQMDIKYEGRLRKLPEFGAIPGQKLAMDDQINAHMVELAAYSSWYPQFVLGGPVQVELEVSLPAGWVSVCSGVKLDEQVNQGQAITRWSSAKDFDILIVASPDYKKKSIRQSGIDIDIYHTQMPKEFIEGEASQIAAVVKLYTDRLGETYIPGGTVRHVYSPKRKGQGKAGIARPGLIVTSEGLTLEALATDPHFSLFQPIAHEIAHFWWHFGTGQGDWINESFAEYFSAVAVQKNVSEEEFKSVLADYRKQVSELPVDAPSISNIPFSNDAVGFVVRYYKGALMLHNLRKTLGEEKFFQACHEFYQTYKERPVGTGEFRSFWKEKLTDQKHLVDAWLDSKGGLPSL